MDVKTRTPLQARDLMTTDPVCVTADITARELARVLEANQISGVPVVDTLERVIGVISKTDLLRRCVEGPPGSDPSTIFETLAEELADGGEFETDGLGTVGEFMSSELVTASPEEPIGEIAARMAAERVHRVIVIDDERHVLGIVTSLDLLKVFPA